MSSSPTEASSTSTAAVSVNKKEEIYDMECQINHTNSTVHEAISADGTLITIIGYGSLLSKKSSLLTFPNLQNFRCVRIPNYQRMFVHPTSIFFQRNIANLANMEMASLSCEHSVRHSFIAIAFEIPVSEMMDPSTNTYTPKKEFVQREEEFAIIPVPYLEEEWNANGPTTKITAATTVGDINNSNNSKSSTQTMTRVGMMCARSSDELYFQKWGPDHFQVRYQQYGINTIWNYPTSSSIKPCTIYLYHCYKAAQSMGLDCFNSFLDDTYLIDRATTIRQYVHELHPTLFDNIQIPKELQDRYCG
jgi:hypothetical protein